MVDSSNLDENLTGRQLPWGGWSFFGSKQASTEATCLAALALSVEAQASTSAAMHLLLRSQFDDGAWPAFEGDREGSWATALAVSTLTALNDLSNARQRALHWLLASRGKEGHWFWRWKF